MTDKVAFTFDPFELVGIDRPKKGAREAQAKIAEFIVEQVKDHCAAGRSPVAGGEWKRSLSPAYKAQKVAQGGQPIADMTLQGDMLGALECIQRAGELELRVKGRKQAAKAEKHNFTGDVLRQFIPDDGGTFKASILNGIKRIAREFEE